MTRAKGDANAEKSRPVRQPEAAEVIQSGIVNVELGGPDKVVVDDRPYPEKMRGSGFAGCSPANPEDFRGKITDDEGHTYTVGCGCRRCRIVRNR